jgi:hypothetical protein
MFVCFDVLHKVCTYMFHWNICHWSWSNFWITSVVCSWFASIYSETNFKSQRPTLYSSETVFLKKAFPWSSPVILQNYGETYFNLVSWAKRTNYYPTFFFFQERKFEKLPERKTQDVLVHTHMGKAGEGGKNKGSIYSVRDPMGNIVLRWKFTNQQETAVERLRKNTRNNGLICF